MNLGDLFKNVSQLQAGLKSSQEKLAAIRATGTAGGDMVRIVLNGTNDIVEIAISPEALDPPDAQMIQDLVLAAYRDAQARLRETLAQEAESLGLPLKGLFGG